MCAVLVIVKMRLWHTISVFTTGTYSHKPRGTHQLLKYIFKEKLADIICQVYMNQESSIFSCEEAKSVSMCVYLSDTTMNSGLLLFGRLRCDFFFTSRGRWCCVVSEQRVVYFHFPRRGEAGALVDGVVTLLILLVRVDV